jgi:hypothetical protein
LLHTHETTTQTLKNCFSDWAIIIFTIVNCIFTVYIYTCILQCESTSLSNINIVQLRMNLQTVDDVDIMKKHDKYLSQHPEFNSLLTELFDAVITTKPDDIAAFISDVFFAPEHKESLLQKIRAKY